MSALPQQPIYLDEDNVARFRANKIVEYIRKHYGVNLNDLHRAIPVDGAREDWEQFAQLIGYSVSGFGELSYVSDESYQTAIRRLREPGKTEQEARIEHLQDVIEQVRDSLRDGVRALFPDTGDLDY